MATIATLVSPTTVDSIDLLLPIPFKDLVTPYEITTIDAVTTTPNRFPVPPTAWGFCTDPDEEWLPIVGPISLINGAVSPEGPYLEPTIGQIWPR